MKKTKEIYKKTGLGVTSFSETVFNNIEKGLHDYTKNRSRAHEKYALLLDISTIKW